MAVRREVRRVQQARRCGLPRLALPLRRCARTPLLIIAAGIGHLIPERWGGFPWVAGDAFLLGELAPVAVTGTAMGHVTHFRTLGDRLQYRLTILRHEPARGDQGRQAPSPGDRRRFRSHAVRPLDGEAGAARQAN